MTDLKFELVVFDLDFTLWDCGGTWCDCLSPPFARNSDLSGQFPGVIDSTGRPIRLYDDVSSLLDRCDHLGLTMALASRTEQPEWARQLLHLLGIADRFPFQEIYPTAKTKHFAELAKATGVNYEQMCFFDDEMRNIRDVGALGVTSVYVEDGLNQSLLEAALKLNFNDGHPF